jgi:hypothetical protein
VKRTKIFKNIRHFLTLIAQQGSTTDFTDYTDLAGLMYSANSAFEVHFSAGLSLFSKWDLANVSDAEFSQVVTAFRNLARPPLAGYDVVFGHVAKRSGGSIWVRNTSSHYPLQYKFETANAANNMRIVGLVPLQKYYY